MPHRPQKSNVAIYLLLIGSLGLIAAGLSLPAISVSSFWLYREEYSILDGISSFFERGQTLLGVLILTVSVIFPIAKILLGIGLLALSARSARPAGAGTRTTLNAILWLSKWSMTDVFAFALIILLINGQLLASADLHDGLALFAAGVLLSAFAVGRVRARIV